MKKSSEILVLALCLGVLICSAVYILLTASGGGHLGMVEGDQVLYMQYARSMAIGHPYVFTPGDTPSTGSTSHLYPLLLAGLYALGAHGNAFLTAIFIINSLFFLGIITCVWLIASRMSPRIMPAAVFLTAISGQTLATALGQTDMGLFSLLALATFAALLYSRHEWAIPLAFLCGLTRPEGFVFAVAFFLCGTGAIVFNRKKGSAPEMARQGWVFLGAALAGFVAFGCTLYVNYRVTGYVQFMSVMNKGYFHVYPFWGAIQHTLLDAGAMIKGVFFGLSTESRQFFVFPVVGGLLGLCGIFLFPRHRQKVIPLCEWWFLLCTGATLLSIAISQWQGLSNDRYFGWVFPLWGIYGLIGVEQVSNRLKLKTFLPMSIALLLGYQTLSILFFCSYAYSSGAYWEKRSAFCEQIALSFPEHESFGSTLGGSMQYFLPRYQIYNLSGITAPAFFQPHFDNQIVRIVEILKHNPDQRFTHWLIHSDDLQTMKWLEPFVGALEMQDTDSALTTANTTQIHATKWDTLQGGDTPALPLSKTQGLQLIDRMDVGYQPDEAGHQYSTSLRFTNTRIPPILLTANLRDHDYSDVGRIVAGHETFTVHHAHPDQPLLIVLRTARKVEGDSFFGQQKSDIKNYELNKTINLRLFVDGQEMPCPPMNISREGFNEVTLEIPAEYVKTEQPHIKIVGDHISFAYWFYQ